MLGCHPFMTLERQIPKSLSIVSYLFLIYGILMVIDTVCRFTRAEVHFDTGILGIWIFGGLRRYSRGWRTCALVLIWIDLIVSPLLVIYSVFGNQPAYFMIFGLLYASVSAIWVMMVAVGFFSLALWQYRVLTRPDIRRLFYSDSDLPGA